MQCIPMFENYFWSSSVNYKSERMWVLRLLCSGLNIEDDAQLYIRNSVPDTLLSFYSSPLSDDESRDLLIEVKMTIFVVLVWIKVFLYCDYWRNHFTDLCILS